MASQPPTQPTGAVRGMSVRDPRPGVTTTYEGLQRARTIAQQAAFFLPHLRSGLRVLDCGCGLGNLTRELATVVTPGLVVGIDREPTRIVAAHRSTGGDSEGRASGGREHFHLADVMALPFPDATFDAVFAHALLMYLPDPVAAAQEIWRVMKPGGVFGARDTDLTAGRAVCGNLEPLTAQALDLVLAWYAHRGTDLEFGRKLRGVLTAAGFARVEASLSADSYGTPEAVRQWANTVSGLLEQPGLIELASLRGVDKQTLERMQTAWLTWGEQPQSFHASPMGQAIGWKDA